MSVEERLAVVETELRDTRADLAECLAELRVLTAAYHRGKGALGAIIGVSGLVGAAAGWLLPMLFGKA